MHTRPAVSALLASLLVALAPGIVTAQEYPAKPIRILVAFPPGSSTDIVSRLIGQKMSESMGQSVIVENRGGAGGNVGAQVVAKAPADGYTLLSTSSAFAINVTLYANPGFAAKDFVPIIRTADTPGVITVHPAVTANTLRELMDLAKKQPLSYASSGTGTGTHILMEWLKKQAGADITHVPFTPAAAVSAVVGNQAPMGITSIPPAVPHVKAARLRAVAVTSDARSPALPDVPTLAEAGFPGLTDVVWLAIFAPAGTPMPIVNKLNAEMNRALEQADVREKLVSLGFDSRRNTQPEFAKNLAEEIAKYAKAIKEVGVTVD